MRLQEEYDEEKKGEKDYEDFLRIIILNYLRLFYVSNLGYSKKGERSFSKDEVTRGI